MQCDELWSFVDNKGNQQWVRLALDANTREMVGVYVGVRDEAAAQQLWASLPPVYRQGAIRAPRVMPPAYCLHRLLGSLCSSVSKQTASGSGQKDGQNQLYGAT